MSEYHIDFGISQVNKKGEELCGDNVAIIEKDENTKVIVLADGLGSGVKANILSTLTAKILSTMIAGDMSIEECVKTIALTLPVCEERKIAYSTFTIIRIVNNEDVLIIQYDNPPLILLRYGKAVPYKKEVLNVDGKKILYSKFRLIINDVLLAISDGAIYAGTGPTMNFNWQINDIEKYIEKRYDVTYSAKTLSTIIMDKCLELYENEPSDDTTIMAIKVKKSHRTNIVFGPPKNEVDDEKMVKQFIESEGDHIVCGGTTAKIVARYLHEPVDVSIEEIDEDIPPKARIKGIDLVTEGIITMSRVVEYAKNYLDNNEKYIEWNYKNDGASAIARYLFDEATQIEIYVGTAVNKAHQNPNLAISFNLKMKVIETLVELLKRMDKKVNIYYF